MPRERVEYTTARHGVSAAVDKNVCLIEPSNAVMVAGFNIARSHTLLESEQTESMSDNSLNKISFSECFAPPGDKTE